MFITKKLDSIKEMKFLKENEKKNIKIIIHILCNEYNIRITHMYLFIKIKVLTRDIQAMKPEKIYKLRYQRVPLYQSPERIQNRGLK